MAEIPDDITKAIDRACKFAGMCGQAQPADQVVFGRLYNEARAALDAAILKLESENARLRDEWAQEGIGWLRDKDIDRLMGVEDENKRLRERLEDKTSALRVEIAAKQGAYNEIRIMEMALRRAVRALDEEQAIQPESQIHHELKDALPPPPASQGEGE